MLDERATILVTGVEHILLAVSAVVGVTVHTHARTRAVVDERRFIEVSKIPFIDAHVPILLITRCDAPVGDATCTDGVVANIDQEGAIARPTALAAGSHRHAEMRAPVLIEQLVPLVDRKIGIVASNMNATAEASFHGNIDSAYAIIGHGEVERRNVDGHGHADVVWEDVRLGACLSLVGRLRVAGNEQQPTEHAG